jgi:TonB family protein
MKTIFKTFLFALAIVLVQACGSKTKEGDTGADASAAAEPTAEEKAAQDKLAAKEKREAAQKERLRIAEEKRAAAEAYYKDSEGNIIYNRAEVSPTYIGGDQAMMKYFSSNLKYPTVAEANGWEGTIYVEFVVGKDGQVRDAFVTDETDTTADQSFKDEAIRVVDNMPKWVPGRQLGKPVITKYHLPIVFRMSTI